MVLVKVLVKVLARLAPHPVCPWPSIVKSCISVLFTIFLYGITRTAFESCLDSGIAA